MDALDDRERLGFRALEHVAAGDDAGGPSTHHHVEVREQLIVGVETAAGEDDERALMESRGETVFNALARNE